MEQYFPAPGPTKTEFDTLSSSLTTKVPGRFAIGNETATTSANGNASITLPSAGIVISAWTTSSDRIVTQFPKNNTTGTGNTTWYLNVRKATDFTAVTSTEFTFYFMYYIP